MKVLIAPDSFKGSLSAYEVGQAAGSGVKRVFPDAEMISVPMADGGEGSIEALSSLGVQEIPVTVTGPSGETVHTSYITLQQDGEETAFIECARSTGLPLIHKETADPYELNSYGLGEQIKDAVERGYKTIMISLGGSATTDGGTGMLQALGFQFLNATGDILGVNRNVLTEAVHITDENKLAGLAACQFIAATDVTNPFYGTQGAAYIYGPQKGATAEQVPELDHGLQQLAKSIQEKYGRDVQHIPGAGAAGGLGGALAGVLGAELKSGFDIIAALTDLEEKISSSDLVITGEGSLDAQSLYGKVPVNVARMAKKHGKSVVAIAGTVGEDIFELHDMIDAVFSIQTGPRSLEDAMNPEIAAQQITQTTEQIMRLWKASLFC
ncbi:glycerate kinase family protein [Thalassobacillus devorans]|uniref:glycerate kinase family protein n=1 Tax=Thalassobacillus devorans TaxID=279813 RepID=UPI000A1CA837|nr:glycerate kinase [Thalassobacillus devorans]